MTHLTLNSAKITNKDGFWFVEFMRGGSFLVGQQIFGGINPALRFCRERALRVIACEC